MSARPLHALAGQALREFGWRGLALAAAVEFALLAFGNGGGYFLIPLSEGVHPLFDPRKDYVQTFLRGLLGKALPLVFAVRAADLAVAQGTSPWKAYPTALLAALAWDQAFLSLPLGPVNRSSEHLGRRLWHLLSFAMQAGTGSFAYALWRSSERDEARVRKSEAVRARDLQQLRAAELLALQARVDPQLLFDALGRVGELQRVDPGAADALLADLIALLRAMLPRTTSTASTVEREFAVVQAWLRIARALDTAQCDLQVVDADAVAQAELAPMLALPMLRAVLRVPRAGACAWRLGAEASGGRLRVTLAAIGASADNAPQIGAADLQPLRERLARLHGDAARLQVAADPQCLALDLPLSYDAAAA